MADRDRQAVIVPRPRVSAPPLAGGGGPGTAEQMPPFGLPGAHFGAGLAWLVAGAVGLTLVAPDLARGRFLMPAAVAVTHCFTLGWITTSIFGALYQLFPVTLGVPARSVRVAYATFWMLQAGVLALVLGAAWWRPIPLAGGWLLVVGAVGGLSWNLLPQRRRATRGQTIGRYVSAAHMALGLAMAVAALRIGETLGWWTLPRLSLLAVHVHFAVVGFATFTVVGVGSRLFPMFLLSRGHAEWPLRWIGPVAGMGLVLHAAGVLARLAWLATAGGGLIAAGLALYLVHAATCYARRTRRALDPGMAHAAAALVFLAVTILLGLLLLARRTPDARLMAAYGVAGVGGWLSLVVIGMYYKIVPFLTWMHRFSPRVGETGLPRVADLTLPWAGWSSLLLLAGGAAVLVAAVAVGAEHLARVAAWLFAAGVALVAGQHTRIAILARRKR